LVEQGTENPRVGGSIPSLATINTVIRRKKRFSTTSRSLTFFTQRTGRVNTDVPEAGIWISHIH
jgi:hypothetical protein